jgi:phenylacetate-CoA ligase
MADNPFPPRSAIRSQQIFQLRRLLHAITPANRFYAAKFRAAGIAAQIATLDDLAQLPFTTKGELVADQEGHPPFGTNLTFPLDQFTRYHQTSGTTGTPLRWLDTPQSWDWMVERWIEIFRAASVGQGDRVVFAFSFGPFIGFWLAFEAAARLGALCLPAGGLSSGARVGMVLDNQATVLCCTPTYALRLAEAALEDGLDLGRSKVRRIIVAGELGGSIPGTRARLETLWPGARVFDHHGMTETGPVSYECPACPGSLHVMESGFVAEVIDPVTSRVVGSGEPGELVLTNLGRTGSPLIRYRTGDLVKAAPRAGGEEASAACDAPCACGRSDVVLAGGILGRVDDMVIVRGVNVYPSAVEHLLRACGGIAEYQVKVTRSGALTELEVVIEPDPSCQDVPALRARVRKSFQQAFALRIPLQTAPRGTLPRFEMKAKRWLVDGR